MDYRCRRFVVDGVGCLASRLDELGGRTDLELGGVDKQPHRKPAGQGYRAEVLLRIVRAASNEPGWRNITQQEGASGAARTTTSAPMIVAARPRIKLAS
jgi:hypothetical protein